MEKGGDRFEKKLERGLEVRNCMQVDFGYACTLSEACEMRNGMDVVAIFATRLRGSL